MISRHEGWCFQIKGKYRDELAKHALQNAKTSHENEVVGLYPAMKAWREAHEMLVSFLLASRA